MEPKTFDTSSSGATPADLNPLEVPLILENIFSFLGHRDLNACRQVSKLWNSYSRKAWSISGQVNVICGKGNPRSNVTEFVKFVRKRGMDHRRYLYTNFTLHGLGGVKTFWNISGPSIKVLRLHGCHFPSVDDFQNVVYKLTPNMQELDLVQVSIRGGPHPDVVEPTQWTAPQFGGNRAMTSLRARISPGSIPVSWMELLSHFPELKVLNLVGLLRTDEGRGKELFSTLAIILQQSSTEIKLRHTSDPACSHNIIPEAILPELVAAVELPQLRLESLCICMNGPDASSNLRRILVANAGSLRTLRLYRNDDSDSPKLNLEDSFRLPEEGTQLEKLQEIGLIADGFETLSFLTFVPNLAKFTLTRIWCQLSSVPRIVQRTNLLEMNGVTFPNCTQLKVGYTVSAQEIRTLRVLFPNVTKLRMASVTDATLYLVRVCWPDVDVERNELYTYWT